MLLLYTGTAGETGDTGPTGEIGPIGDTGPTGETGPKGDAGEDGEIGPTGYTGPAGDPGPVGEAGPIGPTGYAGPTGPKGLDGIVGTIRGTYDDLQDLTDDHPSGNPGEFYYISPNLFAWDENKLEWVSVGPIQGPQGLQGEEGAAGAAGPEGPIGETGPTGETGPAGVVGATGEAGPIGPTGYTGPTGDTGPQGEAGPAGETGPSGPSSGAIIAFAHGNSITPSINSSNKLTSTKALGFGQVSGSLSVKNGDTFTIGSDNSFITFPAPYDMKITNVVGRYATVLTWTAPSNMSLYIAVAIAPIDSTTYTIVEESKAIAPPYERTVKYPAQTSRTGIADNLNIDVKKGENIAVIVGYSNSEGKVDQSLPFNFTGSIAIERI